MRDRALLYVNGQRREVAGDAAFTTLSDYLRYELRLTGTKVVCAEGDCGACTVLLGRPGGERPWRFLPVNACILATAQVDGAHVLTIESVAEAQGLHEVQRAMVDCHGSQCGFCTPGFVMALLGHFEHHADRATTAKEAAKHLTGNLCRCTGYQPILDAAESVRPEHLRSVVARYHTPAIAAALEAAAREPLHLASPTLGTIDAPVTVEALVALRASLPDARLLSGNTDLGVLVNKQKLWPAGTARQALSLHLLRSLEGVTERDGVLRVGARATLTELERACAERVPELSRLLRVFAAPQLKNVATLAGNVANGSPIGDTIPALYALGAHVELQGPRGVRAVPIESFYTGYRQTVLAADEVVTAVGFAVPDERSTVFRAYKVCQRKDLDISFVGAAYSLAHEGGVVRSARVAYGGVGPTVLRLREVEARLEGVALRDADAWETVAALIEQTVTPRSDLRGSLEARRVLSGNLFRRFGAELRGEVSP